MMKTACSRGALQALILGFFLSCTACTTVGTATDEGEAIFESTPAAADPVLDAGMGEREEGGEVPLAVAESEPPADAGPVEELAEAVVEAASGERHEVINDLVSQAKTMLRDVQLQYFFTGKGKRETLRGRPVAFALWSESKKQWSVAQVEIPRPPVKWKPGGKPLAFTLRTPGFNARHVKGTGAERLMFAFAKDGEQLKVYGRKFPVFDSALLAKKRWRAVAETAKPIVYLPFTEDTLDANFVAGGKEYLLATARKAIEELRAARAPSVAFPGESLADVVPAEVLTTLAVIEQMDDNDFRNDQQGAVNEVLSQYGLKREEAYRYSVSSAAAIGPMQFTNRRGNGTYALVVRRCREARIDPDFERGATNLLNAMKAAICLFDIELAQMRADIRVPYRNNKQVLGIFPVAAYNGGPRNVTKLYNVMKRMKLEVQDLRPMGQQTAGMPVSCPCFWRETPLGVSPVSIPKYNNENRWYVEKYQTILKVFE